MIAQMLLVGFKGTQVTHNDAIYNDITKHQIGGVILFDYDLQTQTDKRNIQSPQQLQALTKSLQKLSKTPLFIAVDYEGGRVNRLKEKYGFKKTFSQKHLGEIDDANFTYTQTKTMAQTLHQSGINLNFAPVVDLAINPDNPVIAKLDRSYAKDAKTVIKHASQAIKAYKEQKVIPVLKHFPGHGSSQNDSHLGVVDVSRSYKEQELIPYKKLIAQDQVDAIMTAHIYNTAFDADLPATLSYKTVTTLLRKELGFRGVVFSDDLQMRAITQEYSLKRSLELLINAGVDVIVIGNNLGSYDPNTTQKVIASIHRLLQEGKITQQSIENSYNRIMQLKKRL